MAAKRLSMKKLNQILKFKEWGYSIKKIARDLGLARNTVKKYLYDDHLEITSNETGQLKVNTQALQSDTTSYLGPRYGQLQDYFGRIEQDTHNHGVTRQLLWKEYKEQYPDGYNYSQYCHHYQTYMRQKDVVMHFEHEAGEEAMIDFAGKTMSYVELDSGQVINCQVFIGVLPFSGLVYVQAVHTQNTYDFNDCINGLLKYYGGSPKIIVCDNLKTAVNRPSKYEPVFTELCEQLAQHYHACFNATRPYKPRDKAMVERYVNIVYNHIYAPVRHQTFHSLEQLNAAIREKLEELNHRKYQGSAYSRWQLYREREQDLLIPLPTEGFKLKKVVQATVQRNYHIQLSEGRHYYSVPYQWVGRKVKVLYDQHTVEIFADYTRIAVHQRHSLGKAYHTLVEHMPAQHQYVHQIKGWTKVDLIQQAAYLGCHVEKVAEHILAASFYPEQNYKACYGLIMLKKQYTAERIDRACQRALTGPIIRYSTIRDILYKGLDQQTELFHDDRPLPGHDNIRGPQLYQ